MANHPPPFYHHPSFSSGAPQFMGTHAPPHTGFQTFMHRVNAGHMGGPIGAPPPMHRGPGFFHQATNATLNNPAMVDYSVGNVYNYFDSGTPVLIMLYDGSIKGTEIDSKERHPPPRCHPGTRKTITEKLHTWVKDCNRKWDLTWVLGYAGVGKTAVAQTVGEWAKEQSILGAAFFFSRTRNLTDPSRLFISIAYQLASQNEQYRHLVSQQLSTDFGLLDKDIRTQFKKLLVEPLSQLDLPKKLLIIIDGLDECAGHDEQREIINLVGGAVDSSVVLPVIWMVCSRPESHIKQTFSRADFKIKHSQNEVAVDDSETRKDIELYIRDGFRQVMQKFIGAQDDGSWPEAEDLEKIVSAASGLFVYASTIVKFVGDDSYADPDGQLKAVIAFIENSPAKLENPLHYLDKLYEQILLDVTKKSLPVALQLLAASSLYPAMPVQQLACLFNLSKTHLYTVLYRLHSVVDIPPPDKASQDHIQVFHASFMDFLKDPARSGQFALNERDIHNKFAKACLGVLRQTQLRYAKNLSWPPNKGETPAFMVAHHIFTYCATNAWTACTNLGDTKDPEMFDVIINFNYFFLCFVEDKLPAPQFHEFCLWLRRQIQQHDLENIIQPIKWKTDYLRETFGPCTLDSTGPDALRSLRIGKEPKCITVMMSSDRIMLSRED